MTLRHFIYGLIVTISMYLNSVHDYDDVMYITYLQKKDVRIILGDFDADMAKRVFCVVRRCIYRNIYRSTANDAQAFYIIHTNVLRLCTCIVHAFITAG